MKISSRLFVLLVAAICLLAVGCGKKEERVLSEKEMYDRAFKVLNRGSWEEAIKRYEELSATYPYGRYAAQGDLEICYAHYKFKDSVEAQPCIDRFLSLHPTHPHIDYAYYLKGLILLPVKSPKFGEALFKSQEQFSDHDAESAKDAYAAFAEVIQRFPLSQYADSARQILVDLNNTFARHDIQVARFYLYKKAYIGAVNRAKSVLEQYARSQYTEEALAVLIYAYDQMSMTGLAEANRLVLSYNFPGSAYLNNEHNILDNRIVARNRKPLFWGAVR